MQFVNVSLIPPYLSRLQKSKSTFSEISFEFNKSGDIHGKIIDQGYSVRLVVISNRNILHHYFMFYHKYQSCNMNMQPAGLAEQPGHNLEARY